MGDEFFVYFSREFEFAEQTRVSWDATRME
jgi:hypothetical protein